VDDPRGVQHALLVHAVGGQLHPADPVAAALRHDQHAVFAGAAQQAAAVLPQPRELRGVAAQQAELAQQAQDAGLDVRCVQRFLEELADLLVRLERRTPRRPGALVEGAGAVEEVFDVVGADPHRASLYATRDPRRA
jgi:hypothetical protein